MDQRLELGGRAARSAAAAATIAGRSAGASIVATAATSAGSGRGRNGGSREKRGSAITSRSASALMIYSPAMPARSSCAGAGAPDMAERKAWRMSTDSSSILSTCALNFVTGSNIGP